MQRVKRRLIIFIAVFLAATCLLGLLFWPVFKDLQNPEYRETFSAWIASLGFKGVLLLFAIQILQVVVAVIPGGPVELIAGAAYGAWKGFLIIEAGCAVATTLVFFAVRKFGLPFIKRFFGDELLDSWSFLRNEKRVTFVTFILFLIPGTPKDTLTYLAPLSRLSLLQFVLISVFARFPAILSTTIMGDAFMEGEWTLFISIFVLTAIVGIIGIQMRDRIVARFSKRP